MSTDQDWIGLDQDWSQFWPDQDWIGLQFFENWLTGLWSDWENLCFNVIILKISKILVVIRFHRFAKWRCIFWNQMQKLCWDYFEIRTVSTFSHITLISSSNMNIVEWLVQRWPTFRTPCAKFSKREYRCAIPSDISCSNVTSHH